MNSSTCLKCFVAKFSVEDLSNIGRPEEKSQLKQLNWIYHTAKQSKILFLNQSETLMTC